MAEQRELLKEWIDTLSEEKMKSILLELVIYGIDSEEIGFYEGTSSYWRSCGDRLDEEN